MQIRLLRDAKGSPDGINVYHYEAGSVTSDTPDPSVYAQPLPISERLAALFVAEGWAVDVNAEAVESGAAASVSVTAAPVESPQEASAPAPASPSESEPEQPAQE